MNGSATPAPNDVWLEEIKYGPQAYYQLWVDGTVYTTFICTPKLTWNQMSSVEKLYREALTYWSLPDSV